jgi:hypothetical protein
MYQKAEALDVKDNDAYAAKQKMKEIDAIR